MNELKVNKKADKQKYYKEYNEKNKDYIYEKLICEICKGEYQRCNKSSHNKNRRHKEAILINELEIYKQKLKYLRHTVEDYCV